MNSLGEKIKHAKTIEDVDKLISESSNYQKALEGELDRWDNLARSRWGNLAASRKNQIRRKERIRERQR
jgi:hypothetical protein